MKFKAILLGANIARAFHTAMTVASDVALHLESRVYAVFKAAKEAAVKEAQSIASLRTLRSIEEAVQAQLRADLAKVKAEYHAETQDDHAATLVQSVTVVR